MVGLLNCVLFWLGKEHGTGQPKKREGNSLYYWAFGHHIFFSVGVVDELAEHYLF